MFSSAGNDSEENRIARPARFPDAVAVGAVHWNYSTERIAKASYSSYTKEVKDEIERMVEVMGFSSVHTMTPKFPDMGEGKRTFPFNGTSGSSPWAAGMQGLVTQIKKMSLEEFRSFKQDNVMDLEDEGYCRRTGYGLYILPDPEEVEDMAKKIEMWIDNPVARVDDEEVYIDPDNKDVSPSIIDKRTRIPLRFIGKNMDYQVDWSSDEKKVTLTKK